MRRHRLTAGCIGLCFLVLLFSAAGCVTPGGRPEREIIGTLDVIGTDVRVDGVRAQRGANVYSGNNVSTGPGSSAIIRLRDGGFIQLDENTDPEVEVRTQGVYGILTQGYCILVKIVTGQVYVESAGRSICVETYYWSAFVHSMVNVTVAKQRTVMTVLEGAMTIIRPSQLEVRMGQQVVVSPGHVEPLRSLSGEDLGRVIKWRAKFGGTTKDHVVGCEGYARTAVEQNRQSVERRCGFTGPRWNPDFKGHYEWCVNVPADVANAETSARAEALRNQCAAEVPAPGDRVRCEQYARTAVEQNRQSVERRCGFTGPRWNPDFKWHYEWCVKVPTESAAAETRAREEALRNRCSRID